MALKAELKLVRSYLIMLKMNMMMLCSKQILRILNANISARWRHDRAI